MKRAAQSWNPYSKRPILLVPRAYLKDLPTINPDGAWDYCVQFEAETLRNELNFDIATHVDKK